MSHRVKKRVVGREPNNLCPCGSGKKYKKCCGSPAYMSAVCVDVPDTVLIDDSAKPRDSRAAIFHLMAAAAMSRRIRL